MANGGYPYVSLDYGVCIFVTFPLSLTLSVTPRPLTLLTLNHNPTPQATWNVRYAAGRRDWSGVAGSWDLSILVICDWSSSESYLALSVDLG